MDYLKMLEDSYQECKENCFNCEPSANSVDYAFYVFNRYSEGDTVLKWIVK